MHIYVVERKHTIQNMRRLTTTIALLGLAMMPAMGQGTAMAQRPGNLQLPDDQTYSYLYFHMSDRGQWTAYALSEDGLHFHDLLCGDSIFSPTQMAGIEGGTRDAYICRRHDNKGFLMVTTDMNNRATRHMGKSSEWENYGIDLMTSTDLINWLSTSFDFRKGSAIFTDFTNDKTGREDLQIKPVYNDFSKVCRVWAPQVIWDDSYRWPDGTIKPVRPSL